MRRTALCLVLAAAPVLGGCTLTFGLTGGLIDNASMRRPATVYTLDTPPPFDAPVELVLRHGGDVAGAWRGTETSPQSTATPTAPARMRSLVVLHNDRGQRIEVAEAEVVQIRSRPRRSKATTPMLLTGLLVDGLIVIGLVESFSNSCVFQGCDDSDY